MASSADINPTQPAAPRLGLVAGEASGDLLAGLLLDGVRQRWPQFQAQGIGGSAMAQRGFEAWWPQEKLAVRGYVEVLPRYFYSWPGIVQQAMLFAAQPLVRAPMTVPST